MTSLTSLLIKPNLYALSEIVNSYTLSLLNCVPYNCTYNPFSAINPSCVPFATICLVCRCGDTNIVYFEAGVIFIICAGKQSNSTLG